MKMNKKTGTVSTGLKGMIYGVRDSERPEKQLTIKELGGGKDSVASIAFDRIKRHFGLVPGNARGVSMKKRFVRGKDDGVHRVVESDSTRNFFVTDRVDGQDFQAACCDVKGWGQKQLVLGRDLAMDVLLVMMTRAAFRVSDTNPQNLMLRRSDDRAVSIDEARWLVADGEAIPFKSQNRKLLRGSGVTGSDVDAVAARISGVFATKKDAMLSDWTSDGLLDDAAAEKAYRTAMGFVETLAEDVREGLGL